MKKVKVKPEAQYGGKVKYNLKPPCMKAEAQDEEKVKWDDEKNILFMKAQNEESVKMFTEIFSSFLSCKLKLKSYQEELAKAYFETFVNTQKGEISLDYMTDMFDEIREGFRFAAETNAFIETGLRTLLDDYGIKSDEFINLDEFIQHLAWEIQCNV